MDFAHVIDTVSRFFEDSDLPLAIIGGISMAAYGTFRTTFDVDRVTTGEAQGEVTDSLESEGYQTIHRSDGYSNHTHPSHE